MWPLVQWVWPEPVVLTAECSPTRESGGGERFQPAHLLDLGPGHSSSWEGGREEGGKKEGGGREGREGRKKSEGGRKRELGREGERGNFATYGTPYPTGS